MRCLVRTIATQNDSIEYRDAEYVVDEISLGCGSDSTLHLEGRGVLPRHALISLRRDGRVQIRASSGADLQVNGQPQRAALLMVNDQFNIGPHCFSVIPAPHGFDIALALSSAAAEQEPDQLTFTPGPMNLQQAGVGRRGWAWLLMSLVLLAGLVLPLAWSLWPEDLVRPAFWPVTDNAWSSGPLHSVHRIPGLVDDCRACHQTPFVQVQDAACKDCHATADHVPHGEKSPAFAGLDCAGCHREHNEPASLVRQDEALCVSCHGDLAAHWPQPTALENVADFSSHPPFRLSLLQPQGNEWKTVRVPQDDSALVEQSRLKFSHAQHLNPAGIDGPSGNQLMACADCHQPQQNGRLMQPIRMEQHCASCHSLAFEATDPARQVPHGEPEQVLRALEEYYARLYAIQGGPVESVHQLSRPTRRPGKPPRSFYAAMKAWADERAFEAATNLLEESACHSCHEVSVNESRNDAARWQVVPVQLNQNWMPLARFDHGGHLQMQCGQCHQAEQSELPTDVLMPDLASCKQCHGGEDSRMMVSTGCVGCHGYHPVNSTHTH